MSMSDPSVFTLRHQGYKAGVFLLCMGFLTYLIGFASPYWATAVGVTNKLSEGLHMYCKTYVRTQPADCYFQGIAGYPIYFHAVRALAVFGLIGLLISAIYALGTNSCRSVPFIIPGMHRILEIFAGISAILCLCACIVYGAMRNNKDAAKPSSSVVLAYFLWTDWTFGWAFYVSIIGSVWSLLAAIIIGVFNKELQAAPKGMVMAPVVTETPYVVIQTAYANQAQP